MKKNSFDMTIVQLLCVSKLLGQRQFGSDKRLVFIILDVAVEIALRSYATSHHLIKIGRTSTKEISLILGKLQQQNKLVTHEKRSILKYHLTAKKKYRLQKSSSLNDKTVEDYFALARILIARLYDFRASKSEWQKLVNKTAKSLCAHVADHSIR